ncbi:MAG: peptidylprolyl isomerase [archaeon]
MKVKKGDKIKVEYTGTLEDGTVFDSSETHGQPLEFEARTGMVIKGFDEAVIGMEKDEEKEITLKPTEAYGERNEQMIQTIPKDKLPPEAEEGAMLVMGLPNGAKMPVKIIKMDDKEATLDMNHPLAGKTLKFKFKVVEITEVKE